MDFSSVQIKEAVEMIEARIPGGRWLVRIALLLLIAVLIVWSLRYLWERAITPLSKLATSLLTGASLNVRVTIGDVIVWIAISGVLWWLAKLIKKNVEHTGRLITLVGHLQDMFDKLMASFASVADRVSALERAKLGGPESGPG